MRFRHAEDFQAPLSPLPLSEETAGQRLARIRRKVLRRLEQIAALPQSQQTTLLRTIDTFLEVASLKTARR